MANRINYEELVNEAFIGLVKGVLSDLKDGKLEPNPALYLSFRTKHSGVEVPLSLKEKFPEEMTIVLQYQYEDLQVKEDFFSVILSFSGKKEFLKVPFSSLTKLYDIDANFTLRLLPKDDGAKKGEEGGNIISLQELRKKKK